jgi:Effector-associated domain 11/SIR2-like domain
MAQDFNHPDWHKRFRNLITDIKQQKCVLLIGPEIVTMQGVVLREALRRHLHESNADDIAHYYERDNFFLFKEKLSKEDVQREVSDFYESHHTQTDVEETIFKKIVRLKSHLVLSINPDHFLSNVAYKYGIEHRFAYFQHGGGAVAEVEEPTSEKPLFYNLCGAIERDDSLVLDYDDLFSLLSSLLGTPGLPLKLKTTLQQAKHFLFIGFDFDKWYSQLLLRVLSGEKAIRKFAIDPNTREENTHTFLVKQFGIEFIEDEKAFFEELYKRCEAEGLLREIIDEQTPIVVQITQHIQKGELDKALAVAIEKGSGEGKNEFIQLSAQYKDLMLRHQKGGMDSRDYTTTFNKITDALLQTIKRYFDHAAN